MDIKTYNAAQSNEYSKICNRLEEIITQELKKAESYGTKIIDEPAFLALINEKQA